MAFKIFELGLKKYGDIPEYILAYIDYLSHLNGRLRVVVEDMCSLLVIHSSQRSCFDNEVTV